MTDEERRAIDALNRLARTWPKSLWLFSASGTLNVMLCAKNGQRAMKGDGYDPGASVATVKIPNDGGDW